jgi:LmbE family N-acetylglucosaminyl deacetylase
VAPERGAAALGSALAALGTTGRVLTIAAHPDDEDTPVLAWLARGRHVETAYLSLTRGDGGQNLIGQELGEALGAIRTQELLAARRIDGARQYFTRAYDFGFSKDANETLRHWPRDTVLGDVVRVVRAVRPQVVVAFFSGTPRDGHGHHQLAGMLAREAFDAAADTVRFPVAAYGLPWTPAKFYRSARQQPDSATLAVNTGAYDPLLGRSWYEISAESRSQHKSQGFGMLQRKGVVFAYLRREAARAGPVDPRAERSVFDGVDTSWTPHRAALPAAARPALDSAVARLADARRAWRAEAPDPVVAPLAQAVALLRQARAALEGAHGGQPPARLRHANSGTPGRLEGARVEQTAAAAHDALALTEARAERALLLAAGVTVEAIAPRLLFPVRDPARSGVNDSLPVEVTVFNRGGASVRVLAARAAGRGPAGRGPAGRGPDGRGARTAADAPRWLAPDSSGRWGVWVVERASTTPWWRAEGRAGDWFMAPVDARDEMTREAELAPAAQVAVEVGGVPVTVDAPVVYRTADPVKGDLQLPVAAVPGITVGMDGPVAYLRAGVPVRRAVRVRVQSAYPDSARVLVKLLLPRGLVADSVERWRTLRAGGGAELTFLVRGALPAGAHSVAAVAYHEGTASVVGYGTVAYDHITPQRLYGRAMVTLSAVAVVRPAGAQVGYVLGTADGGAEALRQLDIPVTQLDPDALATTELSRYTTLVLGPRALESHPAVAAAMPRLLAWAARGGSLVLQYGAQDMGRLASALPFPLQWTRPAARVTREEAPVTALAPRHPLLAAPNRIGAADWDGWVQERATYMPSVIDPRYTALLAMQDPGEAPQRGALLTVPVGRGRFTYVTLALFRQLPAGVPGAARLLANLVAPAR